MKPILIKSFEAKKDGVVLTLTEKTSLITGHVEGTDFWVSWDKIGALLFKNYEDVSSLEVAELRALRGELDSDPMTQEKADKMFETELGQQLSVIFTTSDNTVFIDQREAGLHTNEMLNSDPEAFVDTEIIEWYRS